MEGGDQVKPQSSHKLDPMVRSPSCVCTVVLICGALIGVSCSQSLNRSSAGRLIREHERERYVEECATDFLDSSEMRLPGLLALSTKLGGSICTHDIDVVGISLTSDTARDVDFTETRIYDGAKLAALSAYVNSLFAQLSALPVQAIADTKRACSLKNRKCSQYRFAVIDPSAHTEFPTTDQYVSADSLAEDEACECGVFWETAKRAATGKRYTIDNLWNNSIPSGLSQHRYLKTFSAQRIAHFQLFDDGCDLRPLVWST